MRKIAIIGGTGIEDPKTSASLKQHIIQTPFGPAQCAVGEIAGNQVVFMARHGTGHAVPPHKVNYRAHIWALKSLGTEEIFATTAVGSLNPAMKPGHFVVCDQVLDFTKSRVNTFYNGQGGLVAHVDFTNPYCSVLRAKAIDCLQSLNLPYHKTGCYVCTEGPRFETAAEIKMYGIVGGDLVGMTNMPESFLAREAEMCYVNCSIVSNMAAGISQNKLSHHEVLTIMAEMGEQMNNLIQAFIHYDKPVGETCSCAEAMKEFGGFQLEGFNHG